MERCGGTRSTIIFYVPQSGSGSSSCTSQWRWMVRRRLRRMCCTPTTLLRAPTTALVADARPLLSTVGFIPTKLQRWGCKFYRIPKAVRKQLDRCSPEVWYEGASKRRLYSFVRSQPQSSETLHTRSLQRHLLAIDVVGINFAFSLLLC